MKLLNYILFGFEGNELVFVYYGERPGAECF